MYQLRQRHVRAKVATLATSLKMNKLSGYTTGYKQLPSGYTIDSQRLKWLHQTITSRLRRMICIGRYLYLLSEPEKHLRACNGIRHDILPINNSGRRGHVYPTSGGKIGGVLQRIAAGIGRPCQNHIVAGGNKGQHRRRRIDHCQRL